MEDISINRKECIGCGSCLKYCPTNAISLRTKEFIEAHGETCPSVGAIDSEDGYVYSYIDKDRCCGCGSCANLCIQGAINLKRDLGPVVIYSHIDVNQDICVACELCEDNCPVSAIKVVDGEKAVFEEYNAYWVFYVDGQYASLGIDQTPIEEGKTYKLEYTKG